MARETDKTQALINFVQLVFKVVPREELVEDGKHKIEQDKMGFFLRQFRVRRDAAACFTEYTRESFFHRILNRGLRALKEPYELVYLRLPFSHLFWSIKLFYQRHKRAIFESPESQKKIILYRGFVLGEEEIKALRKNVGGYIETEGFLSTSLSSCVTAFKVNAELRIEIPAKNLRGAFDNGFAKISGFSEEPREREVLVNAFNVFRVLFVHSALEEEMMSHTICLEYGALKPVEEKVKKSENLLNAEFMWRLNVQELKKAKKALAVQKK